MTIERFREGETYIVGGTGESTVRARVVSRDGNLVSLRCEPLFGGIKRFETVCEDGCEYIDLDGRLDLCAAEPYAPRCNIDDLERAQREVERQGIVGVHLLCDRLLSEPEVDCRETEELIDGLLARDDGAAAPAYDQDIPDGDWGEDEVETVPVKVTEIVWEGPACPFTEVYADVPARGELTDEVLMHYIVPAAIRRGIIKSKYDVRGCRIVSCTVTELEVPDIDWDGEDCGIGLL